MPANQSTPEVTFDIRRNPESIWLSPICDDTADHGDGRTWASPAPEEVCEDPECGEPWVRYVREDLATPARGGDELREALADLLDYADRNECTHEETHRGGAIWTICDGCGQKWADDEGGFKPYEEPSPLTRARLALFASTDMAGAGERSSRKLNDWISAALDGPPVEGLTSGEGEPIGAMLICDRTGGRMFTQWPAPERREQEADSIYGSHGGYRTVPLYAASPKATATASVREGILDRETIARTLFNQRQTTHDFDDAAEADPEGDAGTLYSIVCDDADAVIAALTDTGTAATIGGERA